MNEFKKLADELRGEQLKTDISRKHNIHLLDLSLIIITILLAIDLGILFVKIIM